jgi:hypothetical protein
MLPQPLRHGVSDAIREQGHGLPTFQIHQDRAIGVPFPQGKVIHAEHSGRGKRWARLPAEQAQQGVAAHHQVPLEAETHTGLASQGDAEGDQVLGEPQCPSCPRSGDGRQPLRKDTTATRAIAAKPLAHAQLEAHTIRGPRQIG